RRLALDDPALAVLGVGLLVPLHDVQPLDGQAAVLAVHAQHAPALTAVLAGDHLDGVAFQDALGHHSTSGASDTIFMKRLARSSRATGPKMRVPIGSRLASISTTELSSKRM